MWSHDFRFRTSCNLAICSPVPAPHLEHMEQQNVTHCRYKYGRSEPVWAENPMHTLVVWLDL